MQPSRRTYLASLGATTVAASLYPPAQAGYQAKGNIKQSICKWCYGKVKLETPWQGQYVLEVIHTDKTPGQFAGKAYESVRHRATYTFVKQ